MIYVSRKVYLFMARPSEYLQRHNPNPDHLRLQQSLQLPNWSPCCFLLPSFPPVPSPASPAVLPVKLSVRAWLPSLLTSPSGFHLSLEGKLTSPCGSYVCSPPLSDLPSHASLLTVLLSHWAPCCWNRSATLLPPGLCTRTSPCPAACPVLPQRSECLHPPPPTGFHSNVTFPARPSITPGM